MPRVTKADAEARVATIQTMLSARGLHRDDAELRLYMGGASSSGTYALRWRETVGGGESGLINTDGHLGGTRGEAYATLGTIISTLQLMPKKASA